MQGTVKWYDKNKGFGFIDHPDGDVFFCHTMIQMEGFRYLSDGEKVEYEFERTPNGLRATTVTAAGASLEQSKASRYKTVRTLAVEEGIPFDYLVTFVKEFHESFREEYNRVGVNGILLYGLEDTGEIVEIVHTTLPYSASMNDIEKGSRGQEYSEYLEELITKFGGDYEVLTAL